MCQQVSLFDTENNLCRQCCFRFLLQVDLGTATEQCTQTTTHIACRHVQRPPPLFLGCLFHFRVLYHWTYIANHGTKTGKAWEQAYIACTCINSLVVAEDASLEHTPLLFPWPAAGSLVEVARVPLPLLKLCFLLCKQFWLLPFVLSKEGGLTNQRSLFLLAFFAALHVLSNLTHCLHRCLHSLVTLHHEVVNTLIDGSITDITILFRLLQKLNNKYHHYYSACIYSNCRCAMDILQWTYSNHNLIGYTRIP